MEEEPELLIRLDSDDEDEAPDKEDGISHLLVQGIAEKVDKFYLQLYIEAVTEEEVDSIEMNSSNSEAVVTLNAPIPDLCDVISRSTEKPLNGQVVHITRAAPKKYMSLNGIPVDTNALHMLLFLEKFLEETEVLKVTFCGHDPSQAVAELSNEAAAIAEKFSGREISFSGNMLQFEMMHFWTDEITPREGCKGTGMGAEGLPEVDRAAALQQRRHNYPGADCTSPDPTSHCSDWSQEIKVSNTSGEPSPNQAQHIQLNATYVHKITPAPKTRSPSPAPQPTTPPSGHSHNNQSIDADSPDGCDAPKAKKAMTFMDMSPDRGTKNFPSSIGDTLSKDIEMDFVDDDDISSVATPSQLIQRNCFEPEHREYCAAVRDLNKDLEEQTVFSSEETPASHKHVPKPNWEVSTSTAASDRSSTVLTSLAHQQPSTMLARRNQNMMASQSLHMVVDHFPAPGDPVFPHEQSPLPAEYPSPSKQLQRLIKDEVQMSPDKVKFAPRAIRKRLPNSGPCNIDFDIPGGKITIEGEESAVNEAKLIAYEVLATLTETPISIPLQLAVKLQSPKSEEFLKQQQIDVGVNIRDEQPFLVFFTSENDKLLATFNSLFTEKQLMLGEAHQSFINSSDWNQAKDSLERDTMLVITTSENSLLLEGSHEDVKNAASIVGLMLKKNATTKDAIGVMKGIGRFLQTHDMGGIRDVEKRCDVNIQVVRSTLGFEVQICGHPEKVAKAKDDVGDRIKKIAYKQEHCKKAGVMAFVTGSVGKTLLSGTEQQYQCIIEVRQPHRNGGNHTTRTPLLAQAPSSSPQRARSPPPPVMSRAQSPPHDQHIHLGHTSTSPTQWYPPVRARSPPPPAQSQRRAYHAAPTRRQQMFRSSSFQIPVQPAATVSWDASPDDMAYGSAASRFSRTSHSRRTLPGRSLQLPVLAQFGSRTSAQTTRRTGQYGDHVLFSQGSVTLYLRQGDLTQCQADVLVNTMTGHDSDLAQAGTVSRSFLQTAGPALQQEYDKVVEHAEGRCVPTDACGGLSNTCRFVFHVHIKRWKDEQTEKALEKLLGRCFKMTVIYGCQSIAFPTIGCGGLKYPSARVLANFQNALTVSASMGAQLTVYLVAYGAEMYQEFKREAQMLDQTSSSSDSIADAMVTEEGEEEEEEADTGAAGAALPASPPPVRTTPHKTTGGAVFHINAKTMADIDAALRDIRSHINNLLFESALRGPQIERLSRQQLAQLDGLRSPSVEMDVDTQNGSITLTGQHIDVNRLKQKVQEIISQDPERAQLPPRKKNLIEMAEEPITAPSHWKKPASGVRESLKNMVFGSNKGELVDVKRGATMDGIKTLVHKSWRGNVVGHGRDAVNLGHSNLRITKVERIENRSLWYDYCGKRKKLLATAGWTGMQMVAGTRGEKPVWTTKLNIHKLDELVVPEINEVFLFHGTCPDKIDGVVNQGLDFRLAQQGGMFGKGIYFAESSTKADQYTDAPTARRTGDHHIFVTRVLLGRAYVARAPHQYQRPPCTATGCMKDTCNHHEFFDSVIGTHRDMSRGQNPALVAMVRGANPASGAGAALLFREFVIFAKEQTYPEFLVTYERQ